MLCGEEITLTDDRHADVAQHEVGLILQDCNKTLLTVACSADFELPVGQLLSDQRSRFAVVLDAQNSLARLCHAAPRAGWPTHYGPACSVRVAHSGQV